MNSDVISYDYLTTGMMEFNIPYKGHIIKVRAKDRWGFQGVFSIYRPCIQIWCRGEEITHKYIKMGDTELVPPTGENLTMVFSIIDCIEYEKSKDIHNGEEAKAE